MWVAIASVGGLALGIGLFLAYASRKLAVEEDPLVEEIDARLPQTQCGQCGYPGCKPYAEAIARGEAEINRCPPGGQETVEALADLMGVEPPALEGEERPPAVAIIDEDKCIGCTLCIQACPVDAIVGAPKQMHTIIEEACTGCELCLEPCPVDCIHMVPIPETITNWKWRHPEIAPEVDLPDETDAERKVAAAGG
jgi:electron transport complex protein RnfB